MTTPPEQDTSADSVEVLRRTLRDRYTMGDELGRGAMSIVYRAHDHRYGRDVAIKVLRAEYSIPLGTERFIREIQFASRLQHPHILPVLDSGAVDGVLYYVMPCVDGQSLREYIASERQLSIPDAVRIACEIGSALAYAHAHDVVHRDIKPANILLSSGVAVVADFGIAHAVAEAAGDRLTGAGLAIGTPGYMSPEQASGESRLDARSDIYSLGCVLYEMLVGEPPFTGRTPQVILARTLQGSPPAASVARPNVPPALERIIERALSKVPADRFRTATAFVEALKGVEINTARRGWTRWLGEGRRATLAKAAVVVTVAVVGGIAAKLAIQTRRLDPNKVVVFPPIDRSGAPVDSGAAYGVALAINGAFEYAQPLRLIEGWPRLDEKTLANPSLVTARVTREIARDRQARHYVDGDLRRDDAGSLVLTLRLNDAAGDSVVVTRTATAAVGQYAVQEVAFAAISQILPFLLAPGRQVDLTPLTARHPAAVALWIQGELEYRRSRFDSALVFYRRAVEHDSSAAFAAVRGAQSASWIKRPEDAARLTALALRHQSLLPRRHRAFARGFDAYLAGNADTAAAVLERLVAESPEWADAAMALGEVYYHLLPPRRGLDSLAEAAFSRAERADTAFTPALVHLAEIMVRRGDVRRAEHLIERLRADVEPLGLHRPLMLALACVRGGAKSTDWRGLARRETAPTFSAVELLSESAANFECAEAGLQAVRSVPELDAGTAWGAMFALHGIQMAQGRHEEALRLVDSAVTAGRSFANLFYILDVWAGAPAESRAARFDSLARVRWGADYAGLRSRQARWALGLWNVWQKDSTTVRAIARKLALEVDQPDGMPASVLARALEAQLSLLANDTASAIRQLRALAPASPHDSLTWGLSEPLAVERLVLARLLLARGEYAEALTVAEGFDHPGPAVYLPFVPASLVIRYRAAEALGLTEGMERARLRLLGLGRGDLLDDGVSLIARRD